MKDTRSYSYVDEGMIFTLTVKPLDRYNFTMPIPELGKKDALWCIDALVRNAETKITKPTLFKNNEYQQPLVLSLCIEDSGRYYHLQFTEKPTPQSIDLLKAGLEEEYNRWTNLTFKSKVAVNVRLLDEALESTDAVISIYFATENNDLRYNLDRRVKDSKIVLISSRPLPGE